MFSLCLTIFSFFLSFAVDWFVLVFRHVFALIDALVVWVAATNQVWNKIVNQFVWIDVKMVEIASVDGGTLSVVMNCCPDLPGN